MVATAVLEIKSDNPQRKVVTGFFDVGGNNMSILFHQEKNTFGVTQLPYYQTALPVFLMYLRVSIARIVYFQLPSCDINMHSDINS